MRLPNRLGVAMVSVVSVITVATSLPLYGKGQDGAWVTAMATGRSALKSGDYSEAKRNLNSALDSTRMFQTNDPRLGDTYQALGDLYLGDQDYAQAKEYFNRALMVQQATPGIDELKLADTLYGLATASEMLGDRDMAIILLKRVRDIWSAKHGARSPKLIGVLKPLGIYSTVNGDFKVAEDCYRNLVAIQEQTGASSNDIGSSLNLLAATLTKENKLSEASSTAERAVALLNKGGAGDDLRIAAQGASDNLAYINQQLGKSTQNTQIASAGTTGDTVTRAPSVNPAAIMAGRPQPETETETQTPPEPVAEPPKTAATQTPQSTPPKSTVTITVRPKTTQTATSEKPATTPATTPAQTTAAKPEPAKTEPAKATAPKAEPTKIAIAGGQQAQARVLQTATSSTATHVNEFRPWETKGAAGQNAAAANNPNSNWGKIRFLAGGRLISQEEYQAMLLANEAYELIKTEKYRMACDILKKALGVCPTLASAHTNLGLALTQLGDNDEAIDHLRQAIAIDPNRSAAWVNLASAFQLSGQLKESLVTYSEYVHRFPNEPLAKKAQEIASNLEKEVKEQAQIAEAGGGPNASDYFAYASHQSTVRWGDQAKLKVYIQPASGVPGYKSEYDGFCADAFKQWAAASKDKLTFEFVKKPEGADIDWIWTNDVSKVSSVAEGGETNVDYSGKKITHATITVLTKNPAMDSPLSPNQIRSVSLHEIGHALGLIGHSPKPQDIMYCSMPPAMSRPNLTSRDVNTIEKLYTQVVSYVRKLQIFGS